MKIRWFLFFSVLIIVNSFSASLWQNSNGKSLYTEDKAHKVGDILTVMISESASAAQSATRDTKKNFSGGMNAGTGFLSKISAGSASSNNNFKGEGSTETSGSISATISVKVIEVLPNENLVVEGVRYMNVNNDVQEIKLRGEVRPRDISKENTIDSRLLADAQIMYKGRGHIARSQKPNLFQKIIGMIF
jgi:flagellar L-ring protein precursor FlgH